MEGKGMGGKDRTKKRVTEGLGKELTPSKNWVMCQR